MLEGAAQRRGSENRRRPRQQQALGRQRGRRGALGGGTRGIGRGDEGHWAEATPLLASLLFRLSSSVRV